MGFIDLNLGSDVKEKECAPEGSYDLVVSSVKPREYEAKNEDETETCEAQYLQVVLEIEGTETPYANVYHNVFLPTPLDSKEKVSNTQGQIKRLLKAAGVPFDETGFNPDDLIGARFTCTLGVEVDESGKYDDKNALRLPKFKD